MSRGRGYAVITAAVGDAGDVVRDSIGVEVEQRPGHVAIEAASRTLRGIGVRMQLRALATDDNGHVIPDLPITWTSHDPDVVSVGREGIAEGRNYGRGRLTASVSATALAETVDVEVHPPDQIVASGSEGTIVGSTVNGGSWLPMTTGRSEDIWEVYFATDSLGLAAGDGVILRTIDGGRSWMPTPIWSESQIADLTFANADTAVAVGSDGTLLRSEDAGQTWDRPEHGVPRSSHLLAVAFGNANVGIAVGWYYFYVPRLGRMEVGQIFRTIDAGQTWSPVDHNQGSLSFLFDVTFADSLNATIVGHDGVILQSTDGGATWIRSASPVDEQLWGVRFPTADTGVAVGNKGVILQTVDGGVTWTQATAGASRDFRALDFGDARTGVAVGAGGAIWVTTDAGTTWMDRSVSSGVAWWMGASFAPAWRR